VSEFGVYPGFRGHRAEDTVGGVVVRGRRRDALVRLHRFPVRVRVRRVHGAGFTRRLLPILAVIRGILFNLRGCRLHFDPVPSQRIVRLVVGHGEHPRCEVHERRRAQALVRGANRAPVHRGLVANPAGAGVLLPLVPVRLARDPRRCTRPGCGFTRALHRGVDERRGDGVYHRSRRGPLGDLGRHLLDERVHLGGVHDRKVVLQLGVARAGEVGAAARPGVGEVTLGAPQRAIEHGRHLEPLLLGLHRRIILISLLGHRARRSGNWTGAITEKLWPL